MDLKIVIGDYGSRFHCTKWNYKSDFNNETKPVESHLNRFYCYLQMQHIIIKGHKDYFVC